MTTATELCDYRWPQIVGGWQKGDDHRCAEPANHPTAVSHRCWCGAATAKEIER